ncbi:MAG: iron-containing alcohol dehydrogenase [Alphaproteobacteria bacterium]|nr:iron-containing alcohol dehydrogenase [Alphaproteobacteria bacterium]
MTNDPSTLRGNWNFPTTIWFGAGRISTLARACKSLGISNPFLVTDPGLAELPIVKDAITANEAEGFPTVTFSNVKPNPVSRNVIDGVAALRSARCDGVIAFGGGSSLDVAKTIALVAAQGEDFDLWSMEEGRKDWMSAAVPLPTIAIPTTAGTGSEVSRSSVVLDEEARRKVIITHPGMLPGIVIADPELTIGLPAHITAATGMDALAHCLEAYCSPFHNPMCDGVALEGMRLIREHLGNAVTDGTNILARAQLMAAASMGAVAFQKGLGAIHAMSHPVSAVYDTHHGLTNAVVMPYVLMRNRDAIKEKIVRVSSYLSLTSNRANGFQAFIDWTLELRESFGIQHTLKELGVEESRFGDLAEAAAIDPTSNANPVKLDATKYRELYVKAFAGDLS